VKTLAFLRRIVSKKGRPIKISTAAQNAAGKLAGPKSPKKPLSGLWKFLRRKPKQKSAPPAPRKAAAESAVPKNGRLTLAVAAAALIAIALGVANFKLIRVPATPGKAFGTVGHASERMDANTTAASPSGAPDNKARNEPPEVTFYQKLTAQDEQKTAVSLPTCQPLREADLPDRRAAKAPVSPGAEKGEDLKHKSSTQPEKAVGAEGQPSLQPIVGPARYTVQVGAFAQPSIAQEWAMKWKARGYDPFLKPVARPHTGIIYRLYLGNFPSEKQADELVKHLKAKEGISALRLTLRN
jgi:cell division septation protein DedD